MAYRRFEDLPEKLKAKVPDPEPQHENGYRVPVSFPYTSPEAKEKVCKAIDDGTLSSHTRVIRELEEKLESHYNVPFAKACSNGYSALVIALKLANIGPGDDVLIPTFTMVAVLNAVLAVRAKPIFVDCEKGQYNPSVEEYQKKLTPNCRALIVAHTYGVPADCDSIQSFCKDNNLVFIEDIAEAIGTEYKGQLVGTFGDFACASLYANKTITSGDGGFVLSTRNDKELRDHANSYTNHGFTKHYHFLHYESSGNYKMSGLQASFVIPAISDIPLIMEDRKRISSLYRKYLKDIQGLTLMPANPYGKDAPWMFGIQVDSKSTKSLVRQKLANNDIETRGFFFPLHLQPMIYDSLADDEYPVAEELSTTGLYLPTYFELEEKDIRAIAECIKECF